MRNNTRNDLRKLILKLVLMAGLVIACAYTTRLLWIQGYARLEFPPADYAKARGDHWFRLLIPPDPERAYEEYRQAVVLNPLEPDHWQDWAEINWRLSHENDALKAFEVAESLEPTNLELQRKFGDFLLEQGKIDLAAEHHAQAIQLQPALARNTYPIYWGLGQPPMAIAEKLLGDDRDLLCQYWRDCLGWMEGAEALELWSTLDERHPALFDKACYGEFFDWLIAQELYSSAKNLWEEIVEHYYPLNEAGEEQRQALFWNGDFSTPLNFKGGLEWQIPERMPSGAKVAVNKDQTNIEHQSLWINFDGQQNIHASFAKHFFFVDPGKTYRLSYRVNTLAITTDNGPYLRITIHGDTTVQQKGRAVTGTGNRQLSEEFTAPPSGQWVELAICRDRINKLNNRIKGDVWYDDFFLEVVASPAGAKSDDR